MGLPSFACIEKTQTQISEAERRNVAAEAAELVVESRAKAVLPARVVHRRTHSLLISLFLASHTITRITGTYTY
ncbi:hypothetical protein K1719_014715 [Acacia pycnantha]|nr:hypothetical protein K1719_046790 [Acacia pycnantha]KAI9114487.1 hypothetical protein K1719_014715 [Acacia pycnantha]